LKIKKIINLSLKILSRNRREFFCCFFLGIYIIILFNFINKNFMNTIVINQDNALLSVQKILKLVSSGIKIRSKGIKYLR